MSFFSLQIAIIFKSVELQMLLTLKLLTFCPPKERSGMGLLFKFSSPSFNSYCLPYLWFHYIYIRILVFFNRDVPPPPVAPELGCGGLVRVSVKADGSIGRVSEVLTQVLSPSFFTKATKDTEKNFQL